jgi:hypothetical protein
LSPGSCKYGPLAAGCWSSLLQGLRLYCSQGSEAFKGDLYLYSVDHDLRRKLEQIDTTACPLVMLTGDYDDLTPPEKSRETARAIPGPPADPRV